MTLFYSFLKNYSTSVVIFQGKLSTIVIFKLSKFNVNLTTGQTLPNEKNQKYSQKWNCFSFYYSVLHLAICKDQVALSVAIIERLWMEKKSLDLLNNLQQVGVSSSWHLPTFLKILNSNKFRNNNNNNQFLCIALFTPEGRLKALPTLQSLVNGLQIITYLVTINGELLIV